jgi:hypothetical protein
MHDVRYKRKHIMTRREECMTVKERTMIKWEWEI